MPITGLSIDGGGSKSLRLHDLMPYRVREILLVSSLYDAFILEEDGPLTEQIFATYSEQNLSWAPRITHVSNGVRAMECIEERRFDLVIAMPRLEDTNVSTLARMLKRRAPYLPFVVLTYSEADLQQFPGGLDPAVVDNFFLWTGDARILITINKLTEDAKNMEQDSKIAGIPAILVVEDSVRRYSTFITELYSELMQQSQSLVAEGVNRLHALLRMRARPKVLHARSYEEAWDYFERYSDHVFSVVSDVRFYRNGKLDSNAGFALAEAIRAVRPQIPILMQSAEAEIAERAERRGLLWVRKDSSNMLRRLREFVTESLGFGDFVFRMRDRAEVGRARNIYELEEVLAKVPAESIAYHAQLQHFSVWFTARSMFAMAQVVRPASISDPEEMREFLLSVLRQHREKQQEGMITDFESWHLRRYGNFTRLRRGSIGGKARGIAFASAILAREGLASKFDGLAIRVPRTVAIGTAEFDRFVETNEIPEALEEPIDDEALTALFLNGDLDEDFRDQLREVWKSLEGPLAVRSSGLLEDLQFQPFSGVYATYMLPNNHPDLNVRFEELCKAIKAVYASVFSENARKYILGTPFRPDEERMGVAIQQMVGQRHDDRFYPHFSGVALSYNYYPIEGQVAEEGTAVVALGLGQMIVMGGASLRFCPASPGVLPQFQRAFDYVRLSQTDFYGLNLSRPCIDFSAGPDGSLDLYDLALAEKDGTFAAVGSVYSMEDDTVRENLRTAGPRAVTFNNVLKWNSIPLAGALSEVLTVLREGMGCPVEIEFAVDMGDWGKRAKRGETARVPTLYVLQVRPLATNAKQQQIRTDAHKDDEVFAHTRMSLGHMMRDDVRDIVYVKRDALEHTTTTKIAAEIGKLNLPLQTARTPFMLVGPGRWGTSDPRLGVPVEWKDIAGAVLIVETKLDGRALEPSQGTHFFGNLTSLGVGYLTAPEIEPSSNLDFIDVSWLDSLPAKHETAATRHVQLPDPLRIYLDGRRGNATLLKPVAADDKEKLPEAVENSGG